MTTGSETQITYQTKELVLTYDDIKELFEDQGISIDDAEQEFSVILRKTLSGGQTRDVVFGDIIPDQEMVFRFNEASGPSEVS